jgi:RNA polymerase sigma-70 factor (ECF subfamily)
MAITDVGMKPDSRSNSWTRCSTSNENANSPQQESLHSETVLERMLAARNGSSEALGELFESCRNYLLLIAKLAMKQGLQAKVGASDLVQETFFEAQKAFDRFGGETEEDLIRWMTQILEYRIGTALKRYYGTARRDIRRELNWYQLFGSEMIGDHCDENGETPSAIARSNEDQRRYEQALASLSEEQQRVIALRVSEGLEFAAVGLQLNCSAEAARKLFARTIVRLQSLLETKQD